jgi:hypothetical protein
MTVSVPVGTRRRPGPVVDNIFVDRAGNGALSCVVERCSGRPVCEWSVAGTVGRPSRRNASTWDTTNAPGGTVSPSACGVLTSSRSVEQGGGPVRAAGRISSWRRFPRPTVVDGRSGRPAVRPPTAGATPAARRAVRRRAHRHTRGRAGPAADAAGSRHPRRTSPAHQRLQRHAAGVRHPVPHRGPESGLRLRLERGPRPRPTVVCASGRVLSCRRTGLRRRGCRPLRRDRPRSRRAIPALPSSVSWLPARPRSVS